MNRSTIFKEIKAGKSKQEIYDQLVEQNNSREKVVRILNGLPSFEKLKKFKSLNIILTIILALITSLMIYSGQIPTAVFYAILTYLAFSYKINYYYWIIIVSGLGVIGLVILLIKDNAMADPVRLISGSAIILICLILSIILTKKMNVKPKEKRVIYENEHGQSRSYIDYEFED